MANEVINYDRLIDKAMRTVVRNALAKVEKNKEGKKYCFMFRINTAKKGVVLPNYIKAQYPSEITLIIQYQFDNLEVSKKSFSVDLSFGGKIENVTIPFSSILSFVDQEVGLEFKFDGKREFSVLDDFEEIDEDDSLDDEYILKQVNNNSTNCKLIDFNSLKKRKI